MDQTAHQAEWEVFQKSRPATKEPTRIYFAYDTHSYVTRSYPLSWFSDAEWQAPEKTRALRALRDAMATLAGAPDHQQN